MGFNLSDLLEEGEDSLYGRKEGAAYAKKIRLLEILKNDGKVSFIIDDKISAINDTFIKGLFEEVFEVYKFINQVEKRIEIIGSDYFIRLFRLNWFILEDKYLEQ